MRLRQIKKYGNTYIIAFTSSDMKDLKLAEGQYLDIELMIDLKKLRQKK